ncbi:MAG TPA: hypothetical protein VFR18_01540 [Terriglobia bacterium]|nr:hypothetical protein [Terriglobia bacterium]
MPTPESAEAFAKLSKARARLSQISRDLKEALETRGSVAGEQRYRELQAEWEAAFKAFEVATDEFSAIVHRIPHKSDSN